MILQFKDFGRVPTDYIFVEIFDTWMIEDRENEEDILIVLVPSTCEEPSASCTWSWLGKLNIKQKSKLKMKTKAGQGDDSQTNQKDEDEALQEKREAFCYW